MKKHSIAVWAFIMIASLAINKSYSQANTTLSNLVSPTAVNQHILPNADNLIDLGSAARSWRMIYLDSQVFMKNVLTISARGTGNFFTGLNSGNNTLTGTYNSGFGPYVLRGLTTGVSNAALGYGALISSTQGSYNVANGSNSLFANTLGNFNTGVGARTLNANINGNSNVGVGYQALFSNTSGFSNVALGVKSLFSNKVGVNMIAIGDSALYNYIGAAGTEIAVGSKALYSCIQVSGNTAIGFESMYSSTSGSSNTAVGWHSLYTSNGSYNVATGYAAMERNTTGIFNVANGGFALRENTTGLRNVAMGYAAAVNGETGSNNTAIGAYALNFNTDGSFLVAVGDSALLHQGTGTFYSNTALGSRALYENTTGFSNTGTGMKALYANASGDFNTANGAYSLVSNTGNSNTAFGLSSLFSNTSGGNNTAVGVSALRENNTGSSLTAIGSLADVSVDGLTNATALGYNATANASNRIVLGNGSVTSIIAGSGFVIYSDGRFKKDLKENVPGLEFINELRPVTYHYDIHGLTEKINPKAIREKLNATSTEDKNPLLNKEVAAKLKEQDEIAMNAKEKIVYTGFVAQEVEAAAKKLNYDFSGISKPQNDKDVYGLSYADFVVPLVKSVQQLSEKNDLLIEQNKLLQQQNVSLEARIEKLETLLKAPSSVNTKVSGASLEQNIPNPFGSSTVIPYTLPQKLSKAQIVIINDGGKILKTINISGAGKGNLNVDASLLPAGAYQYSLYVDGKIVDSKQLVIVK